MNLGDCLLLLAAKAPDIETNMGLFWIAQAFLEESGFVALGFLLAYGTDVKWGGGNFTVGDSVKNIASKFFTPEFFEKMLSKTSISGEAYAETFDITSKWFNTCLGFGMVVGFTYLKDIINDRGELTERDKKRYRVDAGIAGLTYLGWYAIVGSIGGPVGVISAAGISFIATKLAKPVVDLIAGDCIIDTFSRDGKDYVIYGNGTGPDNTYDIYVNNYYDNNPKKSYTFVKIRGGNGALQDVGTDDSLNRTYKYYDRYGYRDYGEPGDNVLAFSHSSYRDYVYNKLENGNWCSLSGNISIDGETSKLISEDLAKIRNAKSVAEAKKYITEATEYWNTDNPTLFRMLSEDGLSFSDYYKYLHPEIEQQIWDDYQEGKNPESVLKKVSESRKAKNAAMEALKDNSGKGKITGFRNKNSGTENH